MLWITLIALASAATTPGATVDPTHLSHSIEPLEARAPAVHPIPSSGTHDITVYGYVPDWIDRPLEIDFDSMTHVAWFDVGLDENGNVTGTGTWESIGTEFVSRAHAHGTKVHLCLAVFDDATQAAVLGSATKRAHAVSQLAELVHAHGADGVNIDVESLEGIYKDELVLFTQEMKAAVDEVFLATPMVDWWGSYDYDALAMASDGLFIMGYDAHSNGGNPGPIGPLEAGSLWPYWSLVWALEDYRTWGAPDDKIIMGLPLYGREWPAESDAIPGVATADGDSMAIASAIGRAADFPGRYEEVSESPWAWTGSSQLWYDDTDSIAVKIEWAIDEGIQGVGFWAVGYTGGDTEFWNMVDDLSMSEDADADADAGAGADAGPGDDTASPTTDTAEATDSADPADTADPADGGEAGDGSGSGPRDGPSAGYREMSDDDDDEPTPKGCGCSVTHPSPSTFWLLAGVLGLLGRRRENTQN